MSSETTWWERRAFELVRLLYDTRFASAVLESSLIPKMTLIFISFVRKLASGGRF